VPDVSVIVPAYRAAAHIGAALDSAFAQTFSEFEVIVVNDGSPDTPALIEALAPYAPRIRYIQLRANRGPAVARNTGIAVARGRYIAFLDVDDRWSPRFLFSQIAYLDSHQSCGLVYADVYPDDLWLRLALRGTVMDHQRLVLAGRRERLEAPSRDTVAELERVLSVLERFGYRHLLDAAALRIRTMQLIDRLEIEQGKLRILEGNFAAAQYHLAATRERPFRLRLAMLALQVAPRLVRAIYARTSGAEWGQTHTLAPSSR
jgi:glycosyltransferase involved in cell wall biosynthesis